MTLDEAITLLQSEQVQKWNELRQRGESVPELSGVTFRSVRLVGIDFRGIHLEKATFLGCLLSDARFTRAVANGACFLAGTDLSGADFHRTELREANFTGALLAGACFRKADARGSIWSSVELSPNGSRRTTPPDLSDSIPLSRIPPEPVDFREARLTGARFVLARIPRSVFTGAHLEDADFTGANLADSLFRHVKGARSVWQSADLKRASFSGARLRQAVFGRRAAPDLPSVIPTSLFEADLRGARLEKSSFVNADLMRADLRGAVLTERRWPLLWHTPTDLSGADLHEAQTQDVRYSRHRILCLGTRADACLGNALFKQHVREQDFLESFHRGGAWRACAYFLWLLLCDSGRSVVRPCLLGLLIALAFGVLYNEARYDLGLFEAKAELRMGSQAVSATSARSFRPPLQIVESWWSRTWTLRPLIRDVVAHPYQTVMELHKHEDSGRWTPLTGPYYSTVVFSTLGFGDIAPSRPLGQLIVTLEVMLGYAMLGIIVACLASRVAKPG